MELGQTAEVTRAFHQADVEALVLLGGGAATTDEVPETLIGALFSYLLGVRLPGPGTNYLKQQTEFLRQASVGEPLTARVEVVRLRPEKQLADLAVSCTGADGRLVCRGRALVFVQDVEG